MSSTSIALLDVNVLIALCDARHVHHLKAIDWFERNARHGWASCALTQNGTIRIMSNPGYPNSRPITQVITQIRRLCSTAFHHFWSTPLQLVDSAVFNHQYLLGHNQITDTYLLALAVANHGKLLTIDTRISLQKVTDANQQHLELL